MNDPYTLLRLVVFIGVPLLLVIVMVTTGLYALRFKDTRRATIGVGIAHGIGCFMLLSGFCYVVPEFRKIFEEFDLELPQVSEVVVGISNIAIRGFLLFLPAVGGFWVAIVLTFRHMHRDPESRIVARLISASLTGLFTLCFFIAMYGLVLPLFALFDGGLS